jgi:hypothetical protein
VGEGYAENIPKKYYRERQAEKLRPLYFRRRIYTDDENRVTAATETALLHEVALRLLRDSFDDAGAEAQCATSIWNDAVTPRGTDGAPWHRATPVLAPTDAEITAALGVLLKTADRLTARRCWPAASESGAVKLTAECPAESRIGRASTAALLVAIAYPFRGGRSRCRRREAEAAAVLIRFRWRLLSIGPQSWTTGFAGVLRSGGHSARRIGEVFGYSRDTAINRVEVEETKLDSLLRRFLPLEQGVRQPPETDCIIKVDRRSSKDEPKFARQLDAEARAKLAGKYRALATAERLDGFAGRCRLDPIMSLNVQDFLRRAYLIVATYIINGGHILIVPQGMTGVEVRWGDRWFVDRRSDAAVAESYTGSVFREPGLSPDRTPDKAAAAAVMMCAGVNAEGERDSDAEHDAAAYFNIPGAVDIDAPDPNDDVDDDMFAGLTVTRDDDVSAS